MADAWSSPFHVTQPGGAIGEQRGAVDPRRHVGDCRLGELKVGQHLAEHLARLGARHGFIEGAAGKADRGGSHRGAEDVQGPQRDLEAPRRLAQPLACRNTAAVEGEGRERCGAMTSMRWAIEPFAWHRSRSADASRPGASPVRATRSKVGDAAVGDQVFSPSRTYSLPSMRALVVMAATSDPSRAPTARTPQSPRPQQPGR